MSEPPRQYGTKSESRHGGLQGGGGGERSQRSSSLGHWVPADTNAGRGHLATGSAFCPSGGGRGCHLVVDELDLGTREPSADRCPMKCEDEWLGLSSRAEPSELQQEHQQHCVPRGGPRGKEKPGDYFDIAPAWSSGSSKFSGTWVAPGTISPSADKALQAATHM